MKSVLTHLIPALLLATAAVAPAASLSFDGSTIGTSTFHRPTGDEFPSSPGEVDLSGLGDTWSFHTLRFTVDQTGDYDIGVTSNVFDSFLVLYTSFDPSNPVANVIALLDGADPTSTLFDGVSLDAGTSYTLVVTSFWDNTGGDLEGKLPIGDYSGTINGPGNIAVIPEPSACLLGGLGALGLIVRRRRNA